MQDEIGSDGSEVSTRFIFFARHKEEDKSWNQHDEGREEEGEDAEEHRDSVREVWVAACLEDGGLREAFCHDVNRSIR